MADGSLTRRRRSSPALRAMVLSFGGLLALSACLTWIFLAMRAVMDIGGSCGSAGTPRCPDATVWLMLLGIFGGIVALGFYAVGSSRLPGPHLAVLAWSALFLSLGYNFWDYGLSPPGETGPSWGWLISALLFTVMGGGPLLALRSARVRRQVFWADAPGAEPASPTPPPGTGYGDPIASRPPAEQSQPAAEQSDRVDEQPRPDEIVDREARAVLDRAVELSQAAQAHREGRLTDDQFAAVKERILGGGDAA